MFHVFPSTYGQVDTDWILMFGWTIPLNSTTIRSGLSHNQSSRRTNQQTSQFLWCGQAALQGSCKLNKPWKEPWYLRNQMGKDTASLTWPLVPEQQCCHWVCPPRSLCWGSSQCPGPRCLRWSKVDCRSAARMTPSWRRTQDGSEECAPPCPRPGTEEAVAHWGRSLFLFSGCWGLLSWQWQRRSNMIWTVCYWRRTVLHPNYVKKMQYHRVRWTIETVRHWQISPVRYKSALNCSNSKNCV